MVAEQPSTSGRDSEGDVTERLKTTMAREFSRAESFSVSGVSLVSPCFLRRLQTVWHVDTKP